MSWQSPAVTITWLALCYVSDLQNNLHKLKLRLAKRWKAVTEKADEDVR